MSNYFFCYDSSLHKYLHKIHKQSYICAALHQTTHKTFWLYERTPEINKLIEEYTTFMKQ
ncbi:hypothetical protein CWO92_22075 [Heyndrickxia camelliae]|uniref:Uncharacterized protein n=1 Tax=Heyndrickxia camelliae TaxID=1707093 RepID=A0A2N3LE04_9BACI|nr:hypothetical protein CWO92_22075 [Heyndrickxia camelliae]